MDDGSVYCWGNNNHGQCGAPNLPARHCSSNDSGCVAYEGDSGVTHRPTLVGGVSNVSLLGLSESSSCAISRADGSVRCWGNHGANVAGHSRTSVEEQRAVLPVLGLNGMVSISGGPRGTCAVADTGDFRCWESGSSEPLTFRRWRGVRTIFERAYNVCAWLGDDFLRCQPITLFLTRDAAGGPGENFRFRSHHPLGFAVAEEGRKVCAWTPDGRVACGEESSGTESPAALRPVSALSNVVDVVGGMAHFCARKRDGEVWCWGDNGAGQLGDGTTVTRNVPVRVERLPVATAIASGSFFTCALVQDGRVLCWGSNVNGALGGEDRRQQQALDPQEVKW